MTEYVYAGFRYAMTLDDEGRAIAADPLPGTHLAARREKHRYAAIQCYNEDHKK